MMVGLEMKYFVLSPNKSDAYGRASRMAMKAYAKSIRRSNPVLATDLETWVKNYEESLYMLKGPGKKGHR